MYGKNIIPNEFCHNMGFCHKKFYHNMNMPPNKNIDENFDKNFNKKMPYN